MRDALPLLGHATAVLLLCRLPLRARRCGQQFHAAILASALFWALALGKTGFADDADLFQLSTHNIILNRQQDDIDTGSVSGPIYNVSDGQSQFGVFDFDDLHQFNVFFDTVQDDESSGSGAVDSLNVIWLGDSRQAAQVAQADYRISQPAEALRMREWQETGIDGGSLESRAASDDDVGSFFDELSPDNVQLTNAVGIAYGVGAVCIDQCLRADAHGFVLGDSYWMTGIDNQVVGPKAGVVWSNRHGRWSLDLQSLLLLGFNSGQVVDSSRVEPTSIPGALNQPLYARPTSFSSVESQSSFTPIGELRAQSRLQLSKMISLRTTWSTLFAGNLLSADGDLTATLPAARFVVERDDLLVHQFFCGLEFLQ